MARDFWSRRRAAVQAEAEAEVLESQRLTEAQEAEARAKREADKTDEELLAELGLPDPDSMEQGDDFSAFMSKAVPQRLRTRALRKLWVSNPLLANVDGMVDYADDFRDSAVVIPDLKTAYQVGKGMMAHVQKLAAEAEALAGVREMPEEVANTDEAPVEEAVSADAAKDEQLETRAETPDTTPDDTHDDGAQPMPRRHMRFVFADSH